MDKVRNWKQQLEISPPESIEEDEELKIDEDEPTSPHRDHISELYGRDTLADALYERDHVGEQEYVPVSRKATGQQYNDNHKSKTKDNYVPINKRLSKC